MTNKRQTRKRAPRGMGSITQLPNGDYKGIITTGYAVNPITKKTVRHTKTFTGKTRKEVQEKLLAYKYKVSTGAINPSTAPITLGMYKDRWFTMKEIQLKPQSFIMYKNMLRHTESIDSALIKDIQVSQINTIIMKLLQEYSVSYVKTFKTLLISVFEQARKEKLITENVVKDSMTPRKVKDTPHTQEMNILTQEEARELLSNVSKEWEYLLFKTALETGMRKGELRALQFKDLGTNTIKVSKSMSDTRGAARLVTTTKTMNSIRTIHVPESLIQELLNQDHNDEDNFVFSSNERHTEPLAATTITKALNQTLKRAHITKHVRFHDLRHTHATWLIMAGVNIKTVSSRLGHSSVVITLNRYTHALPKQDKEASGVIDKLLNATTN